MGGIQQLAGLAQRQFGVLSRRQLADAGLARSSLHWKVATGELERLHEHVFRLRGSPATWQQMAMAGVLIGGDGVVLSHATAAWLHRLDGFRAPTVVDLSASWTPKKAIDGLRFHRPFGGPPAFVYSDVWHITRVERTLVDLADVLAEEALELALDSARRRYKYAGDWIAAYLKQLKPRGTPGLGKLNALMQIRSGTPTESPLEVKVLRKLRQLGLTPPDLQFTVLDRDGSFVMRVDFAWAFLKVALHVDGYQWHSQRERFDRDARQRSRLQALGWRFVTVTSANFEDGSWIDDLRALLNPQRELALG